MNKRTRFGGKTRMRRKRYYHKTIVLRDMFKDTLKYSLAVVFGIGIMVSITAKAEFTPSQSYVYGEFNSFFAIEDKYAGFSTPTIYDRISRIIPSVKTGEEMMKKYSAKYGGVKKEKKKETENNSSIDNIKIKSIDMSDGGITFRNDTAYTPDVNSLLNSKLNLKVNGEKPTVLIMHTHTSEAYAESSGARSTDNEKNVVRVGSVLSQKLKEQGIMTVHDTSRNDYPAYNGSYTKALNCITENMEKNQNIGIVLDIHRDYAEQENNGEKVQLKPVAEVLGSNTAQVMFVVGTDGLGLNHPNWRENLAFAVQIQNELNKISPKIARPINIRRERFNQHKTKGSLIIEVGTAGNSLSECEQAALFLGEAISNVIKNN